ncbi:MAG: 7-cyano-7-deazaguanine synthase [Thermoplasmatota archaeon]
MKALLLLSGGIDSPVAGRMLQESGVELEALHASFEPITDDASVEKAKELAACLGLRRLHVVKIGEALAKIPQDRDAHRFYFVLQKRLLYRLADAAADALGCDVVATGENLGQVSSQTLDNLTTLEAAARRPVIRPLLGLDKVEIIAAAKEWDTYEVSLGPELCDLLGPNKPATVSDKEVVATFEERLGLTTDLPGFETYELPLAAQ